MTRKEIRSEVSDALLSQPGTFTPAREPPDHGACLPLQTLLAHPPHETRSRVLQITPQVHAFRVPFSIPIAPDRRLDRFVYVYAVLGDREVWLIDSGVATTEKRVANCMNEIGRNLGEVSTLLLTHSHPDHIGATAAIQKRDGLPSADPRSGTGVARGCRPPAPTATCARVQRTGRRLGPGDTNDDRRRPPHPR